MSEMELSVEFNKQRKTTLKGSLTRFVNSVSNFKAGDSVNELKAKLIKQDYNVKEFDKVLTIIICATQSADEQEACYEEGDDYNFSYTTARNQALILLGHAPEEPRIPSQNVVSQQTPHATQVQKHVQLQPISLPKFNGQLNTWPEFADLFKSLVIDNTTLSKVEKLMHLKSCLIYDAATTLSNISSKEFNFEIAWEILKKQYENPKLLIETHVNALFKLPIVCSENSNSLHEHLSKFNSHCRILKTATNLTVNNLLAQFSLAKYDQTTREKWEEFAYNIEEPTYENVVEYLTQRAHIKSVSSNISSTQSHHKRESKQANVRTHMAVANTPTSYKCNFCANAHRIYDCAAFLKLSPRARYDTVQVKKLCINCLGNGHLIKHCGSKRSCFKCQRRHNTLLHEAIAQINGSNVTHARTSPEQLNQQPSAIASTSQSIETESSFTIYSTAISKPSQILLSTILIDVENSVGERFTCRALLDNGSQPHLVTHDLIQRLGLRYTSCKAHVSGIGTAATTTKGYVTLRIFSKYNSYETAICTTIVDKITQDIPSSPVDCKLLKLPQDLKLADPYFYTPGPIDIIIGADLFFQVLGTRRLVEQNSPTLQETEFGWIISGRYPNSYPSRQDRPFHIRTVDPVEQQLRQFWELESVSIPKEECSETYCETHFSSTASRDETGRFVVTLPFNPLKEELGASYEMASKRLGTIETRLRHNPELKIAYTNFMKEYESLGHMTKCEATKSGYFIPHHAVIRENSLTTKCRCVFDASAKTSTGVSLNDALYAGPVIQDDLITILMRFRSHSIVFTADIEKMYRQIRIANKDQQYQQILWRAEPTDPISVYKLNTVTYGMTCAPFLSTRCLKELAIQEMSKSPRAASIIMNDFYVDDCISGCASVSDALELKCELGRVLKSAGFPLQKWRSNNAEVMSECKTGVLVLNKASMNTLGLSWDHIQDALLFVPSNNSNYTQPSTVTKRTILSEVAKLFDPLGLVGPVIVKAKLLLQRLWKLNFSWDQVVPEDLHAEWVTYHQELGKLVSINIPRCIFVNSYTHAELHGFCDASKLAYGCCIYVRTIDMTNSVTTRLLCAKSRVAPVKTNTECEATLPRLELCGALLLAELLSKVQTSIKMNVQRSFCWTDSSIVLCWLASSYNTHKPFVSNRVRQIQALTSRSEWRHVRTNVNPADLISRGAIPTQLKDNTLWWCGPDFLNEDASKWPTLEISHAVNQLECSNFPVASLLTVAYHNIAERFSSLPKLVRAVAYCVRFIKNCKSQPRVYGPISATEFCDALNRMVKLEQGHVFHKELAQLKRDERISPSSPIIGLNPLLDGEGMLRVGGRLRHANIPATQIHPIILPSHNHLTELIVNYEHLRILHAGQQAVLNSLRTRYWPVSGKSIVRKILRRCIRCCRIQHTQMQHIMGDLPASRVTPSPPFATCGIDYCGPFSLVANHRRGARTFKAYCAVFVCFATKAVHLEVVGDLTTDACLNAIRRFVARRGIISNIYSDNGTNFVGCNNELKRLAHYFAQDEVQNYFAAQQIKWHFIPPRSPHFGGLWEAAVKSAKYHLKRVSGQSILSLEEFYTILAQTEACLNSRPLTPISNDINDLGALTPGHFIIGQPLVALPDVNRSEVPINRLSRWQRVQQVNQHFWNRWHNEYLAQLQERTKWKQHVSSITVGALVLVRDENAPPLRWKLGRVREVFCDADSVPRVALVKTQYNTEKMSVKRLCLLPITASS